MLAVDNPPAFLKKYPQKPAMGSLESTVGYEAVNFTVTNLRLEALNASSPPTWWDGSPAAEGAEPGEQQRLVGAYRVFDTSIQVFILLTSLLCNVMMLWCACSTSVFKPVTGRFIKNLACSGICTGLACVPFDIALGVNPRCCWWLHTLVVCKVVKFLQKLCCSITVLSFSAIALDRYYSVLYPLERKITDSKSQNLIIYMWVYAAAASLPVFGVTNVTDVYVSSTCSRDPATSLGHVVYVLIYNVTAIVLPLAAVFLFMLLIRRALSASQKKKVIITALRTPQNSISIPYVSQREAELHGALLAVVLAFSACSTPYGTMVVYRSAFADAKEVPVSLYLTALWLPKVSLITNPLFFLTMNRGARHSCRALLARIHRRLSRRTAVTTGGLASLEADGGIGEAVGLEVVGRSGSQLLEMFNIGQQRIFKPREEEVEDPPQGSGPSSEPNANCDARPRPGSLEGVVAAAKKDPQYLVITKDGPPLKQAPQASPVHTCAYASSSQVAPATPTGAEACTRVNLSPFELRPQWLPETRSSKKRLLPPLGSTPEELITINFPKLERRISRNNKVSSLPAVDP